MIRVQAVDAAKPAFDIACHLPVIRVNIVLPKSAAVILAAFVAAVVCGD